MDSSNGHINHSTGNRPPIAFTSPYGSNNPEHGSSSPVLADDQLEVPPTVGEMRFFSAADLEDDDGSSSAASSPEDIAPISAQHTEDDRVEEGRSRHSTEETPLLGRSSQDSSETPAVEALQRARNTRNKQGGPNYRSVESAGRSRYGSIGSSTGAIAPLQHAHQNYQNRFPGMQQHPNHYAAHYPGLAVLSGSPGQRVRSSSTNSYQHLTHGMPGVYHSQPSLSNGHPMPHSTYNSVQSSAHLHANMSVSGISGGGSVSRMHGGNRSRDGSMMSDIRPARRPRSSSLRSQIAVDAEDDDDVGPSNFRGSAPQRDVEESTVQSRISEYVFAFVVMSFLISAAVMFESSFVDNSHYFSASSHVVMTILLTALSGCVLAHLLMNTSCAAPNKRPSDADAETNFASLPMRLRLVSISFDVCRWSLAPLYLLQVAIFVMTVSGSFHDRDCTSIWCRRQQVDANLLLVNDGLFLIYCLRVSVTGLAALSTTLRRQLRMGLLLLKFIVVVSLVDTVSLLIRDDAPVNNFIDWVTYILVCQFKIHLGVVIMELEHIHTTTKFTSTARNRRLNIHTEIPDSASEDELDGTEDDHSDIEVGNRILGRNPGDATTSAFYRHGNPGSQTHLPGLQGPVSGANTSGARSAATSASEVRREEEDCHCCRGSYLRYIHYRGPLWPTYLTLAVVVSFAICAFADTVIWTGSDVRVPFVFTWNALMALLLAICSGSTTNSDTQFLRLRMNYKFAAQVWMLFVCSWPMFVVQLSEWLQDNSRTSTFLNMTSVFVAMWLMYFIATRRIHVTLVDFQWLTKFRNDNTRRDGCLYTVSRRLTPTRMMLAFALLCLAMWAFQYMVMRCVVIGDGACVPISGHDNDHVFGKIQPILYFVLAPFVVEFFFVCSMAFFTLSLQHIVHSSDHEDPFAPEAWADNIRHSGSASNLHRPQLQNSPTQTPMGGGRAHQQTASRTPGSMPPSHRAGSQQRQPTYAGSSGSSESLRGPRQSTSTAT